MAQDRLEEKRFVADLGIPVAPFRAVDDRAGLAAALAELGYPAILKTRRFGYDGKGQCKIGRPDDIDAALAATGGQP
ncbi:ATP-grasp domain-containing protein, partial [Mycobacterium tuberculosis]|nr:ATP-grasp domain-containing protein [Mycobacterium tuberculosis]